MSAEPAQLTLRPGAVPEHPARCRGRFFEKRAQRIQSLRVARVADAADVRALVAEAHLEHRAGLAQVAQIGQVEELIDSGEDDAARIDARGR